MSLRQKIILMAGPPGSGKTTHSLKLVEKYKFKHISAGDCLREEIANPDSQDSELIKELIAYGTIVPVAITVRLLVKKMRALGWGQHIVVLDGFPRNQDNLYGWLEQVADDTDIIYAICLSCTEETSRARVNLRTKKSGELWGFACMPHFTGLDRDDDNEITLSRRLDTFKNDTLPIMEALRLVGKCSKIDANKSRDDVWKDICDCIDALNLT